MYIDLTVPIPAALRQQVRPYANDSERAFHLAEIAGIAHDNGWPIPEVAQCYERILAELKRRARVQDYLYVFVAKRVTAELRDRHSH